MKADQKTDEYATFTAALKKVLQTSHADMKVKLDAERQAKKQQKILPSARVSCDKD
jgi:hypothetical protein